MPENIRKPAPSGSSPSRREFLRTSLLGGTAFTLLPERIFGKSSPSKRVNLAMIGTGRQGVEINLRTFLGMDNVQVVAVCDVDRLRVGYAKRTVDEAYGNTDCRAFTDFREALDTPGLDAVMITTPDHWHAIIALAAMNKRLHVSCEKAMTRYFAEGRALADLARRTGLVFRLDSECRSHAYMQKAANLVLNGYLGNIKRLEIGVPHEFSEGIGNLQPMPVPKHLNYDMWLGPAPDAAYTVDRVHRTDTATGKFQGRPGWLRHSDYCAGMICNWGGHLLDVANFLNGTSLSGPVSVEGWGKFPDAPGGLWDTVVEFEVQYKYANGVILDYKIDKPYLRVEGDEGWIQAHWFSDGGFKASDPSILRTQFRAGDKLVPGRSDKQDFINAIINNEAVMIDAEAGHRVNSQCLLGLAAIKTGKRLEWDPVNETVTNSPDGEKLMKAAYFREAWKLEMFL